MPRWEATSLQLLLVTQRLEPLLATVHRHAAFKQAQISINQASVVPNHHSALRPLRQTPADSQLLTTALAS